jgi:hypothetical protein
MAAMAHWCRVLDLSYKTTHHKRTTLSADVDKHPATSGKTPDLPQTPVDRAQTALQPAVSHLSDVKSVLCKVKIVMSDDMVLRREANIFARLSSYRATLCSTVAVSSLDQQDHLEHQQTHSLSQQGYGSLTLRPSETMPNIRSLILHKPQQTATTATMSRTVLVKCYDRARSYDARG